MTRKKSKEPENPAYCDISGDPNDPNLASAYHARLRAWIEAFNNTLDAEHEVGIQLVNFGSAVTFNLTDMGYCNPSLLLFKGVTEEGAPVELIQHVTQVSILLTKMLKQSDGEPKRAIGFLKDLDVPDDGEDYS